MHWTLADRVAELAQENHTSWNQMAVSLIEIGIPLFNKIKSCSPALAKDLSRKRYTYQLRPRAQERLEDYAEDEAGKHRLDAILGFALPHQEKERIRGEARRSGRKMSAIARERIGVKA